MRIDQALYPCGHDRWGAVVHISKLGPPAQRRVGSFLDDAHGQNGATQLDDECLPDRQRRQRIGLSVQHCWLQLEQPPLCLLGLGKGVEMPSQQFRAGCFSHASRPVQWICHPQLGGQQGPAQRQLATHGSSQRHFQHTAVVVHHRNHGLHARRLAPTREPKPLRDTAIQIWKARRARRQRRQRRFRRGGLHDGLRASSQAPFSKTSSGVAVWARLPWLPIWQADEAKVRSSVGAG